MKPQTPGDLAEAVAQGVLMDSNCALAAAQECDRKGDSRRAALLRQVASELRRVAEVVRGQ